MDELKAGIKLTFAVFPESAAFLDPGKGPFYNPTLGHNGKTMQLAALGDLNLGAQ